MQNLSGSYQNPGSQDVFTGHVTAGKTATVGSLVSAAFIGLSLVFITGFSHIDAIHNAAHDTRHSLAFPCH